MTIPVFSYIAGATFVIPLYSGIRAWKTLGPSMKLFAAFTMYAAVHVALEFILGHNGINNHFLLNIFDLVSFQCIVYLYYRWVESKRMKEFFQLLGLAYAAYWALEMSYIEVPDDFQTAISTSANMLLIVSSTVILYSIAQSQESKVYSLAVSWIATGVILYCGGTVIIQAMSNILLTMGQRYFDMMWHVNWTLCIISNILYARSFWCKTF